MTLYKLLLTDIELNEDFCIGIFRSKEEAEEIAVRYLQNTPGFQDYPCSYRIIEKEVQGQGTSNTVFLAQGWNYSPNLDETDIIESDCYLVEEEARAKLAEFEKSYTRDEWSVDCFKIGQTAWDEGFVRVD